VPERWNSGVPFDRENTVNTMNRPAVQGSRVSAIYRGLQPVGGACAHILSGFRPRPHRNGSDNDAGAVSTHVQAGVQYSKHLLWLLLPLVPICCFIQEMVVRLGGSTRRGHAAMIYRLFGKKHDAHGPTRRSEPKTRGRSSPLCIRSTTCRREKWRRSVLARCERSGLCESVYTHCARTCFSRSDCLDSGSCNSPTWSTRRLGFEVNR